jgi:glycosyltransferase involved in cell wall biosynthesis
MTGWSEDYLGVSILVPTHNRRDWLVRLLADLDRQDVPRRLYEVIVIDDGSIDGTKTAVEATSTSYRLSYLRQECRGPAAARNAGLREARGEYVILLDDDIRVGTGFVKAHIDAHGKFDNAVVFGPCWLTADADGTPFARYRRQLEATFAPPVGPEGTARVQAVASANLSGKRALFERLGGYCEELRIPGAEECEFLGRLTENRVPIIYSTAVQAFHDDPSITFAAYCSKQERYAVSAAEALARYPSLARQVDYAGCLARLNGPITWGADGPTLVGRKILKVILSSRPALATLRGFTSILEALRISVLLGMVYRLVIGLHIFQGFRAGLVRYRISRTHLRAILDESYLAKSV